MQLPRLLALLSVLTYAAFSAPAHSNELVARLPRTSGLWAALTAQNVDIYGATSKTLDIHVTPSQLDTIVKANSVDASKVKILIKDLGVAIAEERQRLHRVQEGEGVEAADHHAEYHSNEDIEKFVSALARDNPELATFVPSIGKSVEGRDLFQVKITAPGDATNRKRVWLQSMQHAREWISGATTQYLADNLISAFKAGDERVVKLLNQVEYVITPVANPDGYAYTWTGDRMWRRNRSKAGPVDLNRNWPDHWGLIPGSSPDPTRDTYQGPSAASEPEVQALIKSFQGTPNVLGAIDFHSYSEAILRPHGWTDDLAPDDAEMAVLSQKMVATIQSVQGTKYTPMTKLYPVSGSSRDYFYGMGKTYGLTIELSPNDEDEEYGFLLPPKEIKRVGKELWNGVLVYTETLLTYPKPKIASQEHA